MKLIHFPFVAVLPQHGKAFGFFAKMIGDKGFEKTEAFLNRLVGKPNTGDFVPIAASHPLKLFDRTPGQIDNRISSGITGRTEQTAFGEADSDATSLQFFHIGVAVAAGREIGGKTGNDHERHLKRDTQQIIRQIAAVQPVEDLIQ